MIHKDLILLYGPTAVGKTEFALQLAQQIRGEIINADVGQFYVPLSIGTAKPDWQKNTIPHHLFDILDQPEDLTVKQYRALVKPLLQKIWHRENVPIIVGGSGFYLASLLFPPPDHVEQKNTTDFKSETDEELWKRLKAIDPKRAHEIHPHDRYRIKRALHIWNTTGIKPSEYPPIFKPLAPFVFAYLTRNREELYTRINQRVHKMMAEGWLEEVQQLNGTEWEPFLKKKKLIGYDEIFRYLESSHEHYHDLCKVIAKKTRNYAKRQNTFWRMLYKKLEPYCKQTKSELMEINLTLFDPAVYIKQLDTKLR